MRRQWTGLALALVAVLLEPLGHQVAYTIHFGLRQALQVESVGSHAYFPGVASAAAISIGLILAFALLALGTVRLVLGPQRVPAARSARTFYRLAVVQCVLFVVQETVEAVSVHTNPDFLVIAALALCAQLPVAALATWLITLVVGYLELVPEAIRVILAIHLAAPAKPIVLRPRPATVSRLDPGHDGWLLRRGPPGSL